MTDPGCGEVKVVRQGGRGCCKQAGKGSSAKQEQKNVCVLFAGGHTAEYSRACMALQLLLENNSFPATHKDTVFSMKLQCPRKHQALQVAPLSFQITDRVPV